MKRMMSILLGVAVMPSAFAQVVDLSAHAPGRDCSSLSDGTRVCKPPPTRAPSDPTPGPITIPAPAQSPQPSCTVAADREADCEL